MTNWWQYLRWEILIEFWTIVCYYYFGNIIYLFWFQWLIIFQYEKGYKLLEYFSKRIAEWSQFLCWSIVNCAIRIPHFNYCLCVWFWPLKKKWSRFTEQPFLSDLTLAVLMRLTQTLATLVFDLAIFFSTY